MYTKTIPYKDFKDNARNETVHFNLTEREVFKLLVEFKTVFEWHESIKGPERTLESEEVVEFYSAFEDILLAAWGVPSDDGKHFRKGGRYDFEESALFNACMVFFVEDPRETNKMLEDLMPSGLEEMIKKADENTLRAISETKDEDVRAELERLRAQVNRQESAPAGS